MDNLLQQYLMEKIAPLYVELKAATGAELKVAFEDIKDGSRYAVAGNQPGWAASLIKIPVMIAAFQHCDAGKLSLEEELAINHTFTLDPNTEVSYREEGSTATIAELLNYMILASCNESTNMLAHRLGIPAINACMEQLGCPQTRMSHLLYRGAPLEDRGIDGTSSNTTTPREMASLMAGIYKATVASPESCRRMVQILENAPEIEYGGSSVNHLLRSALPRGVVIGAKCGILEEDTMETGVINRDYALTVMLNKVPASLRGEASGIIAAISRAVYQRYYHGKQDIDGDRERV